VGDPAGEAEETPIPPRGKQVPGAEINGPIWLSKLNLKSNKVCENSLRISTQQILLGIYHIQNKE
jgi:hypothetical protein